MGYFGKKGASRPNFLGQVHADLVPQVPTRYEISVWDPHPTVEKFSALVFDEVIWGKQTLYDNVCERSHTNCQLVRLPGRPKGKGQSDFSDWPLFMPATTYAPTHLARAVPSALRGLTSVFVAAKGLGNNPNISCVETTALLRQKKGPLP